MDSDSADCILNFGFILYRLNVMDRVNYRDLNGEWRTIIRDNKRVFTAIAHRYVDQGEE
jgi:hypothetical protein